MRLPLIPKSWQLSTLPASCRLLVAASCGLVVTASPVFAPPVFAAEQPTADPAPAIDAPAPADAPVPADAAAPAGAKVDEAKPAEAVPDVGASPANVYGINEDAVPPGSRMEWAERREIRVIQKRAILKEGRHGLSFSAGVVPNDDFFTYVAMGLGYQYYFSEDLALHIRAMYTAPQKSSLQSSLQAPVPTGPNVDVRLPQTLTAYALAGVDWNLLHGKLAFFTTHLVEFDLSLNFGVGAVLTAIRDQGHEDTPVYAPDPAGNVGATMQVYITDRLALGLDYTQLFYPKVLDIFNVANLPNGHADKGGVSHPLATTLTLTWFTSALQ